MFEHCYQLTCLQKAELFIHRIFNPNQNCHCQQDKITKNCSNAMRWLFHFYQPCQLPKLKSTYYTLKQKPIPILLSKHSLEMRNILSTYAKYKQQQNQILKEKSFEAIAGSFLQHAQQWVSFWLVVSLTKILQLDITISLQTHLFFILELINHYFRQTFEIIKEKKIKLEKVVVLYLQKLMFDYIQSQYHGHYLNCLFSKGWQTIYSLICVMIQGEMMLNDSRNGYQIEFQLSSLKNREWPIIFYNSSILWWQ